MNVLDTFKLDGRVALVTGGARGLGQVIATALAQAGADVAIASRSLHGVRNNSSRRLRRRRVERPKAFRAQTSRPPSDIARLVKEVEGSLGPIDILFNNAGINVRGPSAEIAEADWDAVIDINLKGPFLCSRTIGPSMVARGWGRIVNMGSILGVVALPGRAPYASAKAGIINLTRVTGARVGRHGRHRQRHLSRTRSAPSSIARC